MAVFRFSSPSFGLEISNHFIRAARVRSGYFGTQIEAVGEMALNQSPWLKNSIRHKSQLSQQITDLLNQTKPKPITQNRIATALPESSIFSKIIQLPKISDRELAQTVPFEAAEFLPLPLEEMYLDWQVNPEPLIIDNKPALHVLVIAAPKRLVDELTETLAGLKLELVGLESQSFALVRSLLPRLESQNIRMIIHLDHRLTTLILATKQVVKFTTTLPTYYDQTKNTLTDSVNQLADEISESLKYYHNRLAESDSVDMIYLTGAGALLAGLTETLSKATGMPTRVGYSSLSLPNDQPIHPRFNIVLGLAARPFI